MGLALAACAAYLSGCGRFPEDPRGTLEGALERGSLRAGAVAGEPWVKGAPPEPPTGVEAELVQAFAAELGLRVDWRWGTYEEIFDALAGYELDVAIGGFTSANPGKRLVGLTAPYYRSRGIVGRPQSSPPLEDLKSVTVVTRSASGFRDKLEREGAIVREVEKLVPTDFPVAAEAWEIEGLGLAETELRLTRSLHAMAVPPGENAMLMRLETFLQRRSGDAAISRRLWEAASP